MENLTSQMLRCWRGGRPFLRLPILILQILEGSYCRTIPLNACLLHSPDCLLSAQLPLL